MNLAYCLFVAIILAVLIIYIKVNHFEEERCPTGFEFVGYIFTAFFSVFVFCEMGLPPYLRTMQYNRHFADIKPDEVELIAVFENNNDYEFHFTIRGVNNAAFVRVEKTNIKRDVEHTPDVTCRYIDSDGGIIIAENMSDAIKDILLSRIEQPH